MNDIVYSSITQDTLKMQATEVFILGDLILDLYITGKVSRISPEAPVPVVFEERQWSVLGGAANVAANLVAFGAKAYLAGRLGTDDESTTFTRLCAEKNISLDGVVRDEKIPTIRKLRVLAGYQQIVRVDKERTDALTDDQQKNILDQFERFLKKAKKPVLVISDYGKGVCTPELLQKIIAAANKGDIPVITDPKGIDLNRYRGSTIIKPNLSEGRETLKHAFPGKTFADWQSEVDAIMNATMTEAGVRNVVLSLSEHGVLAAGKDATKEKIHFLSSALQVADVSGAGDTMIAFLAMGMAAKLGLKRSVQLSNIAAGVVCGKLGTATLSSGEFLAACRLLMSNDPQGVPLDLDGIAELSAQLQNAGKTVVFTNGCFDLLHAGHIAVLQKAKSFGDVLIVGLNSDKSVKRLKGPERPLQNEQDRALILSALGCVDYVTIFEEETPLELIKRIKPKVIVKGGDYQADSIVGAPEVKSWGGRVEIISFVPNRSTSALINKK